MFSLISLVTALLKICIGIRIVAFTTTHHRIKPIYSILAVVFVAYFLVSATVIFVYGHGATPSELVMTVIFAAIIFTAKGNVAELFRGLEK